MLDNLLLARGAVDRAAEFRGPQGDALLEASGRLLAVGRGAVLCEPDGSPAWFGPQHPALEGREVLFLGVHEDLAFGAVRVDDPSELAQSGQQVRTLRELGVGLSDADAGLAVTAIALDNWHRTHVRCPRCGAATDPAKGGWVRICRDDASEHFPRTDPAVIMLVIDPADRALLGRQAVWPEHRYSTLAGFVESGESAEAAVVRESFEEAGVTIDFSVYLGSQPWPFPCSLMLGYHAFSVDDRIQPDGAEIVDARWFTRSELLDAITSGDVILPPQISIARRLIERWYGAELPTV